MATIAGSQMLLEGSHPASGISARPGEQDRAWLLLGLSKEMNDRIEELALRTGDTKADLINKAIGVYKAASDAFREGKRVGIAAEDQPLEDEWGGF